MKHRSFALLSIAAAIIASSAQGAVYNYNFESFVPGNIHGQQGWEVDATGDSNPGAIVGTFGFWGSRAASIGWSTGLSKPSVYVSHAASTPLLGTVGTPDATFSVLFQIYDSDSFNGTDPKAAVRDVFGFRLEDGSGNNLFSLFFTPYDQDPTPENDTAYNTFSYSTGAGPAIPVLNSPLVSAQEGQSYTFSLAFSPSGVNDVAFTGDISGDSFSGVLPGLATSTIGRFGAFWNTSDAAEPGSNQMLFDGVTLIPEPSSALLGLLGASLALVRRRRI
jgi:hypothetical protein